MKCTGHDIVLEGVSTADVHVVTPPCEQAAWFRLSVPTDPWPLQYACAAHLLSLVLLMDGDVHVEILEPGAPTPAPRTPEKRAGDPDPAPAVRAEEQEEPIALIPADKAEPCCDSHRDGRPLEAGFAGCCDPDDCGPCCPACPTCPTIRYGTCPATMGRGHDLDASCVLGDHPDTHISDRHRTYRRGEGRRTTDWPVTPSETYRWAREARIPGETGTLLS